MIDTFNLTNYESNSQVFYTKGTSDWQIWQKPNNAKIVSFLVIGGGGGGGSGQAGTGSTTRRGGGGGGSSSVTLGVFSASQLPDTLFVQVGSGGVGGSGGTGVTDGSGGTISYICVQPNTTAINVLLQSGNAAAGGGIRGASTGAGGTAGTAWTGGILSDLGLATSTIGQVGTGGATTAVPTNVTIAGITTGGAGGAGTNLGTVFSGGSINGSGFVPTILGGTGNVNANGNDGSGGFTSFNISLNTPNSNPLFFTGGGGAGSSNNNTGGTGGSGSYGSGGGGGGCGVTSNGGRGGRGGDGIVIITCI